MTLLLLLARATALVCLALLAARLLRGRSAELRAALLVEWGNLPDMFASVQFDIKDVSDWE